MPLIKISNTLDAKNFALCADLLKGERELRALIAGRCAISADFGLETFNNVPALSCVTLRPPSRRLFYLLGLDTRAEVSAQHSAALRSHVDQSKCKLEKYIVASRALLLSHRLFRRL
jgi:hypothetical protein